MIARIAVVVAIALGAPAAQAQPAGVFGAPPPGPGLPPPRDLSGQPRPSPDEAPGTLLVRVVYNDLADPAADLPVTLVGYAADERVTLATQKTDRDGKARFTGLDRTGATAYFAMTLLPRGRVVDRLVSRPVMLDASLGVRVVLSGDQRKSSAAALDDLLANATTKTVAKGKVDVELVGI